MGGGVTVGVFVAGITVIFGGGSVAVGADDMELQAVNATDIRRINFLMRNPERSPSCLRRIVSLPDSALLP